MDVATRYIPDRFTGDIKMLNFRFSIQGTPSKNSNPSQTCALPPRRGSMSSAWSFPRPPATKLLYI